MNCVAVDHDDDGGGGGLADDGHDDDDDDGGGDLTDDIYIMMSVCLFVCNEKSSLFLEIFF